MSSWFLYALLAATLYSGSIIIDKHLLDRRFQNISASSITALAGVSGIPYLIILLAISHTVPSLDTVLYGFLAGWLILAGYQLYYSALRNADASLVTTLFQFILPINYLLGIVIFKEKLHFINLAGLVLMTIAATVIASEQHEQRWRLRRDVLYQMLAASLCVSLSDTVFKLGAEHAGFLHIAIMEYASSVIAGVTFLLLSKRIRAELATLKPIFKKVVTISQSNEILTLGGTFSMRYGLLLGPIALVQGVMGAQPFIVLGLSGLLAFFFPHLRQHKRRSRTRLFTEYSMAVLVIAGAILITYTAPGR